MINNIIPPGLNANKVKKFFSCAMDNIFSNNIHAQSKYSSGDIVNAIRNAIANKMYIETYVRNYNTIHTPSGDTLFKRIYEASINNGIDKLTMLIGNTVKMAIELNYFNNPVNVAIDGHDSHTQEKTIHI